MKTVDKKKHKKLKNKSKPLTKEKVLVVAQELKFARLLAGNEKKSRDRVLKALKKWLGNCFEKGYDFKEDDFVRVWKGLFYAVWMSDKPLVQEELCDNIASTLDLFPAEHYRHALLMMKAGYKVLATEWYGIDQHRFDKFLMLARRYLRGCLRAVSRQDWSRRSCLMFADMLSGEDGILSPVTPHYARNALSLILHILDCYLEEICKTAPSTLPAGSYAALLRPLLLLVAGGTGGTGGTAGKGGTGGEEAAAAAAGRALRRIIESTDIGIEYETRRRLWQQMGCPEGGPDALVPASDDEDNTQEEVKQDDDDENDDDRPLDPRAGGVDVELEAPAAAAAAAEVAHTLRTLLRDCPARRHPRVKLWAERFEALARNEYPLKVSTAGLYPTDDESPRKTSASDAAKRLNMLERELVDKEQLALRGLSRKHRKRLLAQSRAGVSIAAELAALTGRLTTRPTAPNGNWQVEDAPPSRGTPGDTCDKENAHRHKRRHDETPCRDSDTLNKKPKIDENTTLKPKVKQDLLKITVKDKRAENKCNNKVNDKEKVKIIITESPKKEKKLEKKLVKEQSPQKAQNMQSKPKIKNKQKDIKIQEKSKKPLLVVNKVKSFQKQTTSPKNDKKGNDKKNKMADKSIDNNSSLNTPKKVKFVLKNNSMQGTMDYYKSIRQSPNIPYDSSKKPVKTNLKPNATPSPINPFFKKKLRSKH